MTGLVWILVGCEPAPESTPLPDVDAAAFAELVEPVFEVSCANAACHGDLARPLSLYAPLRHRMEESRLFLDEELTDQELAHNLRSAAAFLVDVDQTEDCDLLRKPLAERWGGARHAGGDVFLDPYEPDYVDVAAWIDDQLGVGEVP